MCKMSAAAVTADRILRDMYVCTVVFSNQIVQLLSSPIREWTYPSSCLWHSVQPDPTLASGRGGSWYTGESSVVPYWT